MVNCDYCNKEMDRHVFCTPSCKVMYHRTKLTKGKHSRHKTTKEVLTKGKQTPKDTVTDHNTVYTNTSHICKHGSMKGLCKKGCK